MVTVHERGEADDPLSALKGLGEQNTFHYWVMSSNIVAIIALQGIRKDTKWYCKECDLYLCYKGLNTECFLVYNLNHV